MLVKEVKTHLPKHEYVSEGAVAVKFAKGDPEDPATGWPRAKRYRGASQHVNVRISRSKLLTPEILSPLRWASSRSSSARHGSHLRLGVQRDRTPRSLHCVRRGGTVLTERRPTGERSSKRRLP